MSEYASSNENNNIINNLKKEKEQLSSPNSLEEDASLEDDYSMLEKQIGESRSKPTELSKEKTGEQDGNPSELFGF